MLFHTWPFAVFFLIVYLIYLTLKETRFRLLWLLASSYFFYAWFNPLYLILILYSTSLDYFVAAIGVPATMVTIPLAHHVAAGPARDRHSDHL